MTMMRGCHKTVVYQSGEWGRRMWQRCPSMVVGCSYPPVASGAISPYSLGMVVDFTPEQQARISQMATQSGTAPERLVTDVVVRYLDQEGRFLAAVEKGIAAADRGEFIDEEEMDRRLEAMFPA